VPNLGGEPPIPAEHPAEHACKREQENRQDAASALASVQPNSKDRSGDCARDSPHDLLNTEVVNSQLGSERPEPPFDRAPAAGKPPDGARRILKNRLQQPAGRAVLRTRSARSKQP
jgi:hypothetical protein